MVHFRGGEGGERVMLVLCQLWKWDGGQQGKQRGQGCDSEITEAPESASVSGLFMRLQGDGEGRAKHWLHAEMHKGAQNRKHETDRDGYCVNTVFTGNMRAVMSHYFVVKLLGS